MKKRLNFKATNIPDLLAQGKNYYSRNPDGVIKHILDDHDRWRERVKRLKSNSGYLIILSIYRLAELE